MNIAQSLFNLVNNNAGLFKSEKQANFLSGFAIDGIIQTQTNFSFGEFNGCTRVIQFFFHVNDRGITKVEKLSAKGLEIHWTNSAECISKTEAKVSAKAIRQTQADKCNKINKRLNELESLGKNLMEKLYCVILRDPANADQDPEAIRIAKVRTTYQKQYARLEAKYKTELKTMDRLHSLR